MYDIYVQHRNIPMWQKYSVYDIAKKTILRTMSYVTLHVRLARMGYLTYNVVRFAHIVYDIVRLTYDGVVCHIVYYIVRAIGKNGGFHIQCS